MPDLSNNPNQPRKRKELTMEVRLIIAFVLMGIVLFISPLIFGPPPAPPRPVNPPPAGTGPSAEEPKKPDAPKPETPERAAAPAGDFIGPRDRPKTLTVETKLYVVKFSTEGGVVKSWVLKEHKDSEGKRLEMVNQAALEAKKPAPFSIMNQDGKEAELNSAIFSAAQNDDKDGSTVSFNYSDGLTLCTKTFQSRRTVISPPSPRR